MEPYPHQIEILRAIEGNILLYINSQERQTGVSTILCLYAINQMIDGKKIYFITRNKNCLSLSHERIVRFLRELGVVCDVNKKTITTSNGGYLQFTTYLSSPVDCRSRRFDTIIFDDCACANDYSLNRLVHDIRVVLNMDTGKMIFSTTGEYSINLDGFNQHVVDTNNKQIYSFLNKKKYGGKKRVSRIRRPKW